MIVDRRPVAFQRSDPAPRLPHYLPDELHRLALRAAVGPDDSAQADLATWEQHVDLGSGLDAGTFRLLPLIADRIERLGLTGDQSGRIGGTAKMAWVKKQQQLFGAKSAIQLLVNKGHSVTLLKGAALSTLTRLPGTRIRPMADVDLLVGPGHGPAAFQALADAGWVFDAEVPATFLRWRHSTGFSMPGSRAQVDLHWRTLPYPAPEPWDTWLRTGTAEASLHGNQVLVPAPDRLLAHAIAHGAESNRESPIRWAADAHLLASHYGEEIDWESVAGFAVSIRMARRFEQCLRWLRDNLDSPVPDSVLATLLAKTSMLERMEIRSDQSKDGVRRRLGEFAFVWMRAKADAAWSEATGTKPHFVRDKWGISRRRDLPIALWQRLIGHTR